MDQAWKAVHGSMARDFASAASAAGDGGCRRQEDQMANMVDCRYCELLLMVKCNKSDS